MNQELSDYIKKSREAGQSDEQIREGLLAAGWKLEDINEAFGAISNNPVPSPQSPMSPQTTTTSLPGATAILGQAWSLYKQRFGTFLGVMIIPMLALIGLLAVLAGSEFLSLTLLSSEFTAGGIGLIIILAIVFLIAIFISQAWGQIALLYAIKDSQEGIGVVEAYRRGWHKIFSLWWVALLGGFIIMGGFLLLVVPGIIFAVWFSLAVFILIAEDLKGMDALLKSREYVKGKWGAIFWRVFFIGAFIGTLSFIVSLVLALVFSLLKVPFGEEISEVISGLFLAPLSMTYMFLVYKNIKAVKGEIPFAPTGKSKKTFIAVGILGIFLIPAILFPMVFLGLGSAREKTRDMRRLIDLRILQTNLELYYSAKGEYPMTVDVLLTTKGEFDNKVIATDLPKDPVTNNYYFYSYRTIDKQGYVISAQLDSAIKDEIFQDSKQNTELNKYTGSVKSCAPQFYCISLDESPQAFITRGW